MCDRSSSPTPTPRGPSAASASPAARRQRSARPSRLRGHIHGGLRESLERGERAAVLRVPQLDELAIAGHGRQAPAIARELGEHGRRQPLLAHVDHRAEFGTRALHLAPIEPTLKADHAQPPAIRIDVDGRGERTAEGELLRRLRQVPQLDLGALATPAQEAPPFRVEREASDPRSMPAQDGALRSGQRIPDADRRVDARGRDHAAVGAERDALHRPVVAAELMPQLAGRDIPDPGRVRGDGQQSPIGAESQLGAFFAVVQRLAARGDQRAHDWQPAELRGRSRRPAARRRPGRSPRPPGRRGGR